MVAVRPPEPTGYWPDFSRMRELSLSKSAICPSAAARLRGSSMVSIFCNGIAHPAMSTVRRLPYSSYLPSQTSSVLSCESGWGFAGPTRTCSVIAHLLHDQGGVEQGLRAGTRRQHISFSLTHLAFNNLTNLLEFGLRFGADSPNFLLER
jgi:hypothetical protein